MSTEHDGGQAFPRLLSSSSDVRQNRQVYESHEGMTLRDYFAAQAMQGMLASSPATAVPQDLSAEAFKIADAMLKARTS